jgi:hypothetical protein
MRQLEKLIRALVDLHIELTEQSNIHRKGYENCGGSRSRWRYGTKEKEARG